MWRALTALACLCLSLASATAATTPTWFDWHASENGAHPVYHADGFTLTLGSRPSKGGGPPTPTLTIQSPGRKLLTLAGSQAYDDPAALVGVVRLDAASPSPQVLFMTYSGGAHCCTWLQVAIPTRGGWLRRDLSYDGDPEKEILGAPLSGVPTLVIPDGAFDYTFASHAGSWPALRLYVVRDGALVDVSDERRFSAFHGEQAAKSLAACRTSTERNGACAAYVAEMALAGDYKAAWTNMLAAYDPKGELWFPTGCRTTADPCPKTDQLPFRDFPHALDWFLWRYGYHPLAPDVVCTRSNCPVTPAGVFRP
ncbi:MAG TPA: hypothetical protein VGL58_02055 [Caulobacteraceae bacterium]|jgi:hypothetical protein